MPKVCLYNLMSTSELSHTVVKTGKKEFFKSAIYILADKYLGFWLMKIKTQPQQLLTYNLPYPRNWNSEN